MALAFVNDSINKILSINPGFKSFFLHMYLVRQFSPIEIHVTRMVFFDGRRRKVAKRVDLHLGSTGRSSRLDASAGDSNTKASRGEYLAPCRTQGTLRNPEGGHAGHRTPVRHVSSFFILFFSLFLSLTLFSCSLHRFARHVEMYTKLAEKGHEFSFESA